MSWSDPPDIIVPLSVGGYIGFTLLGIVALAALMGAALLVLPASPPWGLTVAGMGIVAFTYAAFAYLRTVEATWQLSTVLVWTGLLGSGVIATVTVYLIASRLLYSETFWSWVPLAGVAGASAVAGVFDVLNEALGAIPLSWGAVAVIAIVAVGLVLSRR